MPTPKNHNNTDTENPEFQISLSLETGDCNPPVSDWVEEHLQKIAALAKVEHGYLNILITDDKNMADYHQQYSGVSGTTDVLTFDMKDGDVEDGGRDTRPTVEGDIIICLDQAKREAQERNHDARTEVLLYAVHGLLHLLGEDDHSDDDYKKMHEREDKLLTAAGLGAVFSKK